MSETLPHVEGKFSASCVIEQGFESPQAARRLGTYHKSQQQPFDTNSVPFQDPIKILKPNSVKLLLLYFLSNSINIYKKSSLWLKITYCQSSSI